MSGGHEPHVAEKFVTLMVFILVLLFDLLYAVFKQVFEQEWKQKELTFIVFITLIVCALLVYMTLGL